MPSSYKEITYDRAVGRFRYPEGSFASREAVVYQASRYLDEQQRLLVSYAEQMWNRPNDLALQRQVAQTLKEIHITSGVIAAGGPQNMFANDYLILARGLKNQYGISDNFPQEYGLKFLFAELQRGEVSLKRLVERLVMYGKSAKTAYFGIEVAKQQAEGKTEALRILGFGEHCEECKRYAGFGWVGIQQLILPTQQCSCLTNCLCTVRYR